ncbi:MAG: aminoglycoside phosphotransferase family protein [Actinomycetia bacterium]|nr:aminoglycoside phosphotransferase family protein [Actinomycetes bacterium]
MRTFKVSGAEQVSVDLSRHFGLELTAQPLGGYLGRNELFLLHDLDAVVKVFHASAALKSAREIEVYRAVSGADLPVPRLLGSGHLGDGEPWVALSRMPGQPLDVIADDGAVDVAGDTGGASIWSAMGELLASLHALGTGSALPSGLVRDYGAMYGKIERPSSLTTRALAVVERGRGPVPPSLVHGDFSSRNLLVEGSTASLTITGLFDFERAAVDDPAIDFAMFLFKNAWDRRDRYERFLAGYSSVRDPGPDLEPRALHHLLGLLIEIEGWAIDEDPPYYRRAMEALARVLSDGLPT